MSRNNRAALEVDLEQMYTDYSRLLEVPTPQSPVGVASDENASAITNEPAWIGLGQVQHSAPRQFRGRSLALAAAALLVVVGGGLLVVFNPSSSDVESVPATTPTTENTVGETSQAVTLSATSILLLEPGQSQAAPRFRDPSETRNSDSDDPAAFVRINWEQDDGWHQLHINFSRDDTEWWASELWTSNEGAWDIVEGEFFRSKLGEPF